MFVCVCFKCVTPPETYIEHENQWLADDISFWDGLFSVDMLYVQHL